MSARSIQPETRNPLLKLPASRKIADLPSEQREQLRGLLLELAADAQAKANESWRKHKAPMAAYWKAVAVYARHIARLLRCGQSVEAAAAAPPTQGE